VKNKRVLGFSHLVAVQSTHEMMEFLWLSQKIPLIINTHSCKKLLLWC